MLGLVSVFSKTAISSQELFLAALAAGCMRNLPQVKLDTKLVTHTVSDIDVMEDNVDKLFNRLYGNAAGSLHARDVTNVQLLHCATLLL